MYFKRREKPLRFRGHLRVGPGTQMLLKLTRSFCCWLALSSWLYGPEKKASVSIIPGNKCATFQLNLGDWVTREQKSHLLNAQG